MTNCVWQNWLFLECDWNLLVHLWTANRYSAVVVGNLKQSQERFKYYLVIYMKYMITAEPFDHTCRCPQHRKCHIFTLWDIWRSPCCITAAEPSSITYRIHTYIANNFSLFENIRVLDKFGVYMEQTQCYQQICVPPNVESFFTCISGNTVHIFKIDAAFGTPFRFTYAAWLRCKSEGFSANW